VAAHGNRNASTDTGTAVELLVAALRGAGMNVDVNLKGMSDPSFVERVSAERAQLAVDAEADAARARERLAMG
jgi:formiminotetrahydrofolate cyclodeaminase